MLPRASPFLLCAALALGCTPELPSDAGTAADASSPPADAGDDAGPPDAGSPDAGAADGGPPDAGPPDAGPPDAGPPDAGPPPFDAGPPSAAGAAFWADIPDDLVDDGLISALHERLVDAHVKLSYAQVLTAFESTDTGREGCDGIFDFYSSRCWAPAETCGDYSAEGDCFNREHSWPRSWWGASESNPAHTDLHHVLPADGYVNNRRGNLPFGEVVASTYTSTNGSKVGTCDASLTTGNCFEPKASLKGDLARIYFYMAARYEGEFTCCDLVAVDGADLEPWEEALLREWHWQDPVDLDERARNEAVAEAQGSRNPFVDYPAWVDRVADF